MRSIWFLTCAVSLAACGGDDDPPAPVTFEVHQDCAVVTSWTVPATAVGQTSVTTVVARRSDDGTEGVAVPTSIDGPAAADFTVPGVDTCKNVGVWERGICVVEVHFTPSAAGARTAVLHLGDSEIPLHGDGVAATPGLTARLRHFGLTGGAVGIPPSRDVLLVNEGSATVTLGDHVGAGDGLIVVSALNSCPPTLTPGAACMFQLQVTPTVVGCGTGALTIESSAGPVEISVETMFVGGIDLGGPSLHGRVTSDPPGLDCGGGGTGCVAAFLEDTVTLTATEAGGGHFNGWGNERCNEGTTCTVPTAVNDFGNLRMGYGGAQFASPEAHEARAILYGGSGTGRVAPEPAVFPPCDRACIRWIEPGASLALRARTPSRFTAWSGSCEGTERRCDLGLVINDREVNAIFTPDDGELRTVLVDEPITAATTILGGDLALGTTTWGIAAGAASAAVRRIGFDGTPVWTRDLGAVYGRVVAIREGGIGALFALVETGNTGELVRLDGSGQVTWRQPIAGLLESGTSGLAVLPDGRIAHVTLDSIRVVQDDGTVSWTAPLACRPRAVAAGPAVVAAICSDRSIRRFNLAGNALASWSVPLDVNAAAAAAFDAQGRLVVHVAGETNYIARHDTAGAAELIVRNPDKGTPPLVTVVDGAILVAQPHRRLVTGPLLGDTSAGVLLQKLDDAGTATWTVDKPHSGVRSVDPSWDSVIVRDLACDAVSCSLFGEYQRGPFSRGWIQRFDVP